MSSFSNVTELHATSAVNGILSKILPGMKEIQPNKNNNLINKQKKNKGSKAQLIDHNLKKMISLQKRDIYKIKKKEKLQKKNALKERQIDYNKLEKNAKLKVLQKHKLDGKLTEKEAEYLDKLTKKSIKNAKSWDLDDEEREESLELQEYILKNKSTNKNHARSNKRRQKIKQFKEDIQDSNTVSDHRYAGLTPGLAPVGLSDEEESSSEEEQENDDW
ncbi:similar to Saccharomyces cerevisiae YIL127C RRT14 Putative protein of unknown function [Maudiozyma saulgeensis]|uniref:Regulator of rDNA transcription 14 n=1 Tax=Maudiozyma saulgeensis TaxID=1789683 RepID=A0A1X7QYX7_9SACH|nr:similar to Saccharomyces cerevisiae YIL127C RRT14 Putative protein of unknown function [Kazachstania saulgeensis]